MSKPATVHQIPARSSGRAGDDEFEVDWTYAPPLIPDGVYLAKFVWHETAAMFKGKANKVFLWFEIIDGPCTGTRLYRPFRVHRLRAPLGRNGKFVLRPKSDLFRMLCRLLDVSPRTRPDRVSVRELRRGVVKISTRTVNKDRDQQPLPAEDHYSVVDDILSIEAGA